jgi:hypothetical protein
MGSEWTQDWRFILAGVGRQEIESFQSDAPMVGKEGQRRQPGRFKPDTGTENHRTGRKSVRPVL